MGKLPEGTTFYNHQQNLSDKARKNGCGLPLTGHLQSPQRDPLLLLESCAQQDPSASKGRQERPSALAPISSWLSSQLFRHIEASWGILGISGHKSKIQFNALQGQHPFFTAPTGYSIMARNMQEHNHQGGYSKYSRKQDLRWLEFRGALGVTSLRGSVCTILDTHGQG